jgi:hypothetical protein
MITVNTYNVTERAVVQGVTGGVQELLKDVSNFSNPDKVVEVIAQSVLDQLCQVFEFGIQPVRLTPDLIYKLYQEQEQSKLKEEPKA